MIKKTKFVDRDKLNEWWGCHLADTNYTDKQKNVLVLHNLNDKDITIYTNWFKFVDPYPEDVNKVIPCFKLGS